MRAVVTSVCIISVTALVLVLLGSALAGLAQIAARLPL